MSLKSTKTCAKAGTEMVTLELKLAFPFELLYNILTHPLLLFILKTHPY